MHHGRGEARKEIDREQCAQEKGDNDTGVACDDGCVAAAAQDLGVQLQPDEEHEQHEPDLAQRAQEAKAFLREQGGRNIRRDPAENRGAEQNAGDHFSDDLWLMEPAKDPAGEPGHDQDHANLQEKCRKVRHQLASI